MTTHLTVRDLAERCRVTRSTVYRWRLRGEDPRAIQNGKRGRVIYPLAEVERWERARLQGGAR
jgi:predicted DNA-binding transcriptional regulator AlpA